MTALASKHLRNGGRSFHFKGKVSAAQLWQTKKKKKKEETCLEWCNTEDEKFRQTNRDTHTGPCEPFSFIEWMRN